MVRSVIEYRLHAYNGISGQRSLDNGFLHTLFHSREVILGNGSAHYNLIEYISRLQISRWLKGHLHMAVLSVPAGLLLILGIHIRFLADGLAEGNLWTAQLYCNLKLLLQLTYNHIQVLIAHAVKQSLTVLGIIDSLKSQILFHHLRKCLGNLILISLILCLIAHVCIGLGNLGSSERHRCSLGGKGISRLGTVQLADSSDIACVKLRNLDRLIALHYIELAQLFLCLLILVVEGIVRFDNAGGHLDKRIFSDKGVHDGLKYISGFCLREVVICLENLVGLGVDAVAGLFIRAWEQLYNVIHQIVNVPKLRTGTHRNGNHGTVAHIELHGRTNLADGKFLPVEITLHKFIGGLRNRI